MTTKNKKAVINDVEFEARVLRHQAEIHCRCLHTAIAKSKGWKRTLRGDRPRFYRSGHKDSPPYFSAATLFVERNSGDPLRTEILWLQKQVDWMD